MITPYVYYVKNNITNEFYYGSRFGNVKQNRTPEEDFWIHYFTSSKRVRSLLAIHGQSSFDFEIIFKAETYDECYWVEQQCIKDNRKDTCCINGTYIDPDTSDRKFSSYGITQDELQARGDAISISKAGKGNSRLGTKHTEQTKENMRIAQANLNYTHNEETRKKMKEYSRTAEHSAKLGDSLRGKPWSVARRNAHKEKM